MLTGIELDDQLAIDADEVCDVSPDLDLSSKLVLQGAAVAQLMSQKRQSSPSPGALRHPTPCPGPSFARAFVRARAIGSQLHVLTPALRGEGKDTPRDCRIGKTVPLVAPHPALRAESQHADITGVPGNKPACASMQKPLPDSRQGGWSSASVIQDSVDPGAKIPILRARSLPEASKRAE